MRSARTLLLTLVSAAFFLAGADNSGGCFGPVEQEVDTSPDGNASVEIVGPETLTCLGGACLGTPGAAEAVLDVLVEVAREIEKIEVLEAVQGTLLGTSTSNSGTVSWDTTAVASTGIRVMIRVTDVHGNTYNSDSVEYLVMNLPARAARFLTNENTGEIIIPSTYSGVEEVDVRHHWNNPAGITRIVAVARWEVPEGQEPWRIGVTVGCGVCPHNGSVWGPEPFSDESPILHEVSVLQVEEITAGEFPEDQAFVHLRPANAIDHAGESLPYEVEVYLLAD